MGKSIAITIGNLRVDKPVGNALQSLQEQKSSQRSQKPRGIRQMDALHPLDSLLAGIKRNRRRKGLVQMGSIPERGRGADARLRGPHAEDLEPALESCVKQSRKHSVKPALTVSSRMQ